jgi:hypothetical protein
VNQTSERFRVQPLASFASRLEPVLGSNRVQTASMAIVVALSNLKGMLSTEISLSDESKTLKTSTELGASCSRT